MRPAARWTLALAVLLLAATVALWPRGSTEPTGVGTAAPQPPDLATLRERAALADCPGTPNTTSGASSATNGTFGAAAAGILVPCLGDGATVDVGAALGGRDTLLSVWSHTCAPCRDELPVLQEYADRPDAVPVLGVQVDGSEQAGLAMLIALGVRLPSVTDPDGALRAALSAPQVLPLSYLVAADGSVRMVNPPVVFRSADQVADVVRQYLAGA